MTTALLANAAPTELTTEAGEIHVQAAEGGSPPRFTMEAYSGGKMRPRGFSEDVVLDLTGLDVPEQTVPSYLDHNRSNIVGHTTRIVNDGKRLAAEGLVSGGDSAREVRESARNGFPWKASIGASIEESDVVEAGDRVVVNGQGLAGPFLLVRRSTLREISFVSIAGDPRTSTAIAANGEARTDDDIRREERERLERIDLLCDGEWGDESNTVEQLRAQAVAGTLSVDDLEHRVTAVQNRMMRAELEHRRSSRPTPTRPGGGNRPHSAAVLECALAVSVGIPEEVAARGHDERVMEAALSSENRGMSIGALFHEVIRASGRHVPGRGMTNEVIRAGFEASQTLEASSGFSALSLPGILGNVANKGMLAAYEKVGTTWQEFCRVESNKDFKAHKRYRLNEQGRFEKVGADGELKHASLTEQEYESQLDTWGKMIALTRQMIINDDAGAFMTIPRALGRMAAVQIDRLVYETLLGNAGSFFSAGNNNLLTGAGSALSISGLEDAEEAFDNRVDPNGEPMLAEPEILLVPVTLKTTARQITRDTTVEVVQAQPANAGTNAERTIPRGNPFAGRYKPVWSPWLNNSALVATDGEALVGQSDTHWYLLVGGGSDMAVVEVAFLDGKRVPTVERGDTSFNTLGMEWRAYHDFAAAQGDNRGGVRNAGT